MQLPAFSIETVAPDCSIDFRTVSCVEIVAKVTEVIVRVADMLQFACYKFENDDVIEIADYGNIVREDVLGISKVNERGQQALSIGNGQLPLVVSQHLDQ